MAELNDPTRRDREDLQGMSDVPYAQEPPQVDEDQPRRAASARYIVDAEIGSEAAIRDALDPAHQSLAEALRLSFRVLQAVILVLVVLFLVSGFQTVDDGQTGVKTVWGQIVPVDGSEALKPGAQFSLYPYPIGEFILFRDSRTADVEWAFAPGHRAQLSYDQLLERADLSTPLLPGSLNPTDPRVPRGDGSLLTRDGDLAHLEFSARYVIDDAGGFVRRVNDSDSTRSADRLVRLALQRAAIHVAAKSSLQDLTDQTDDLRAKIQQNAQEVLNNLHCGIQLTQVQVQRAYAPLAIEKSQGDLQAAHVAAGEAIQKAQKKASETLNTVAGKDYAMLGALVEQYEDAQERGDEAQIAALQKKINDALDANENGEIASIIQSAKSYQSEIESTLGNEYRRFASLLPAYRENPRLVVMQQWLEAYANVMSRPDAETIYVPDPLAAMTVSITGSADIQELRRKNELARREREANMKDYDPTRPYILRARDININKAGRMLNVKDGKAVPVGSP